MVMFMIVYWSCECKFVFTTWWTKKDEQGKFIFGCFLTLLYCIFTQLYKISKIYIEPSKKKESSQDPSINNNLFSFIAKLVWYFIFYINHIMVMMLMMTMNGYVNLFIAAGLTIGHLLEEFVVSKLKSKVSDIEERLAGAVNCSETH